MSLPRTALAFMERQKERVRNLRPLRRIVFPEGNDGRVIQAAARLAAERVVEPILIGPTPAGAPAGVSFVDPAASAKLGSYTQFYYERRRAKGITQMEAADIAKRPLYFSSLMVASNDADGFVGGAVNTT